MAHTSTVPIRNAPTCCAITTAGQRNSISSRASVDPPRKNARIDNRAQCLVDRRAADDCSCSPRGDYGGLTVLTDCASRATPADGAGRGAFRAGATHVVRALAAGSALLVAAACAGHAQESNNIASARVSFPIGDNDAAASNSANYALFGLGTKYLQLLGNQGGPTWQAGQFGTGPNPNGGGAPAAPAPPKYRVWTELYGLTSNSGAQAFFPGDARRTYGGVAGFSMNLASNATVGLGERPARPSKGEPQAAETARGRVPTRGTGTDRLVVAEKPGNAGGAKQAGCSGWLGGQPPQGGRSR